MGKKTPEEEGRPRQKKHASAPLVQARLDEVLQLRLDGAATWDVREYVRQKEKEAEANPWTLAPGDSPLSRSALARYITRADRLICDSARVKRKARIARAFARRENLYAKAVMAGDLSTALNVVKDEAKLAKLYPPDRVEHAGKGGGPIRFVTGMPDDGYETAPETAPEAAPVPAADRG